MCYGSKIRILTLPDYCSLVFFFVQEAESLLGYEEYMLFDIPRVHQSTAVSVWDDWAILSDSASYSEIKFKKNVSKRPAMQEERICSHYRCQLSAWSHFA